MEKKTEAGITYVAQRGGLGSNSNRFHPLANPNGTLGRIGSACRFDLVLGQRSRPGRVATYCILRICCIGSGVCFERHFPIANHSRLVAIGYLLRNFWLYVSKVDSDRD